MEKNILIVDIDNCLNYFNQDFSDFLEVYHGIKVIKKIPASIVYDSKLLTEFINREMFLELTPNYSVINGINYLFDKKYTIYIVTSRPKDNIKSINHTRKWLEKCGIKYHKLFFRSNKHKWLETQTFFSNILFIVEDDIKHIVDYLDAGIKVFSPVIDGINYSMFLWNKSFSLYTNQTFLELTSNYILKNGK